MEQVAHLFGADDRGRQSSGWSNKLIWGDNKLVLSSLKNGPLHSEIEAAGGLKPDLHRPAVRRGGGFLGQRLNVGDGETLTKDR